MKKKILCNSIVTPENIHTHPLYGVMRDSTGEKVRFKKTKILKSMNITKLKDGWGMRVQTNKPACKEKSVR